jgi:aryl-alcohol dehydrogenase-like predicted oxidoreductase
MITRTLWNGGEIPALGLGCWAIGGHFTIDGVPKGWGAVDDKESIRAIHQAYERGIRFFDTAQAYGAGHSEELLGEALAGKPDALIGTKVGYAINPATRVLSGEDVRPDAIVQSIDDSLRRLRREAVDLVHLHTNELEIGKAEAVFEALGKLRNGGKVTAFGWSTDFPGRAAAFATHSGFVSVQHALNVFFRADKLLPVIEKHGLISMNRSPLAMGVLSGKYDGESRFAADDVRSQNEEWKSYFRDGGVAPDYLKRLQAVRELLQKGGRKLVQGALAWIWARSSSTLPIPGFRTSAQVDDLADALALGPLDAATMAEIERVLHREPEGEPRAR